MKLNERLFRALLANTVDVVAVLNRDGHFRFVCERVREVFGHDPAALIGRPVLELVHPEDRERLAGRIGARMADGADQRTITAFRLRHADGDWRHAEAAGSNLFDDPDVKGFVVAIRDITAKVEAQERLRRSEALYHSLAEAAPVGIFHADADGRVIFANRRMTALTGLSTARILEAGWFEAIHPDDRRRLETEWARARAGGSAMLLDVRLLGPEGPTSAAMVQATPLIGNDGQSQGTIGTVVDMSEYVRTAEALLLAEARNNAFLDAAADAILTVDGAGIVQSFNRAAEEMFGIPAGDIIWRSLDRLIPDDVAASHGRHLRDYPSGATTRVMGRFREVFARHAEGRLFPVEISISAIEANGQRLFTAIIRDVTERRRIEADLVRAKEAAEAADHAKSAFLATMSHELRTPLNSVIGFAQVIETHMLGTDAIDRYTEYAGSIRKSGEHLLGIIDDILDISKIESGSLELGEQPVAIADAMEQSLSFLTHQAEQRRVAVALEVGEEVPVIRGDALRLRQILVNLLGNAIKFTEPGGMATVKSALAPDGGLLLMVRDTGIGMTSAEIGQALTTFGQVDQSTTRRHEGAGLGLPLTKRLVEMHDGTLDIASVPGEGTTVTVRFPASRVMTLENLDALGAKMLAPARRN